jgi:hypothetical protein
MRGAEMSFKHVCPLLSEPYFNTRDIFRADYSRRDSSSNVRPVERVILDQRQWTPTVTVKVGTTAPVSSRTTAPHFTFPTEEVCHEGRKVRMPLGKVSKVIAKRLSAKNTYGLRPLPEPHVYCLNLVRPERFELPIFWFVAVNSLLILRNLRAKRRATDPSNVPNVPKLEPSPKGCPHSRPRRDAEQEDHDLTM